MKAMNTVLTTVAVCAFGLIASADSVITPFDGGYRVDYTENESEYSAFVYTNTTKTYIFPVPAGCTAVNALVVGGGGAGGHRGTGHGTGGGGGAGGFLEIGDLSAFSAGATMSVKVGAGGIGGSVKDRRAATSGEDSSLTAGGTTYTAHGGGCGGVDSTSLPASSQGSGGGGGVWSNTAIGEHLTGTDEYGNNGGKGANNIYVGGGGGGAGAKGADADTSKKFGGAGGAGKMSAITGEPVYYAGGGGGASGAGYPNDKIMTEGGQGGGGKGGPANYWYIYGDRHLATNEFPSVMCGKDGTGGGGGGSGGTGGDNSGCCVSGHGGSGTVIIRVVKSGAATKVAIPTAVQDLVYTGEPQVGVTATTGCTVTDGEKTDAGDYTATASLDDPEGTTWTDETTDDKQIAWSIAQAENVWTVEPSISPSVVYVGESLPVLTVGTAQFGGTPTVTYDGGQTEMPETLGSHIVTVSVAGTGNWTALTKELSYSIQEPPQEWGYSVHYTSDDIEYAAFVYTNTTKTYTFSVPNGYTAVDALVVGGGGAGGGAATWSAVGGGGGAGGFLEVKGLSAFSAGVRMTVKVGAGGIGSSKSEERNPTSGENSLLTAGGTTYTAHGGGRGGCSTGTEMPASSGGSGGGGGVWNSSKHFGVHDTGQASTGECGSNGGGGFSENGASPGAGGGGGGATGVGTQAGKNNGGAGGAGKMSAITGEPVWYAGGGGGGYAGGTRGAGGIGGGGAGGAGNFSEMCGVDGTGGGGGGAGGSEGAESGNGGNGTVIIRVRKTGAMPPGLMIIINSPAA